MRFTAIVFLALLLLPAVAGAGALEGGRAAFDRQNYQTALRLFQPLADQGNAQAQLYIGEMYEKGDALKQDDAEALKWYRKAADQGDAEAQYRLGEMYEFDKEVHAKLCRRDEMVSKGG